MGATLEALRVLQDVELQIVDIRRQLAAKERAVKRQTAKLRAAERTAAAAHAGDTQRLLPRLPSLADVMRGR